LFGLFFLFLGAIRAPLSEMDDRLNRAAVTDLSKIFVTGTRDRQSISMVWTGLALHG